VNNTGTATLRGITITDAKLSSAITCSTPLSDDLAPGAGRACTGTYTVTVSDVAAKSVINDATANFATGGAGDARADSAVVYASDLRMVAEVNASDTAYDSAGTMTAYFSAFHIFSKEYLRSNCVGVQLLPYTRLSDSICAFQIRCMLWGR
jgi:hypothetical protein